MFEIFHLRNVYQRINEKRVNRKEKSKWRRNAIEVPTVFLRGNRDRDATIEIGSRYFIFYYYYYYYHYLGAAR